MSAYLSSFEPDANPTDIAAALVQILPSRPIKTGVVEDYNFPSGTQIPRRSTFRYRNS
jgi:hypothetical protein